MIAKSKLPVLGFGEVALFVGTTISWIDACYGSLYSESERVDREPTDNSAVLLLSSSSTNNSTFCRRESTICVEMRLERMLCTEFSRIRKEREERGSPAQQGGNDWVEPLTMGRPIRLDALRSKPGNGLH
jgi:hypothetical protein